MDLSTDGFGPLRANGFVVGGFAEISLPETTPESLRESARRPGSGVGAIEACLGSSTNGLNYTHRRHKQSTYIHEQGRDESTGNARKLTLSEGAGFSLHGTFSSTNGLKAIRDNPQNLSQSQSL